MERDRETNLNLCGRSSRNSREAKARKRSEKREDKMKICAGRKGGEKQ